MRIILKIFISSLFTLFLKGELLNFQAQPIQVTDLEDVVFSYLPGKGSSPELNQIKSWRWDFDGDGNWDVERTVGGQVFASEIRETVWRSELNVSAGTGDNQIRRYLPRLQITLQDNTVLENAQPGTTESVQGLDDIPERELTVSEAGVLDPALTLNAYANPRIARANNDQGLRTPEIRVFGEALFNEGFTGTIQLYEWDFDGDESPDLSGADFDSLILKIDPDPGGDYSLAEPATADPESYDVRFRVRYQLDEGSPVTTEWLLLRDFVAVQNVPDALTLGRAYRVGFPEQYGWAEVTAAYSAEGPGNNRYVYFDFLEEAYNLQRGELNGDAENATKRRVMAEVINELLQGQSLRGGQGLIEALRLRYPRITSIDEDTGRIPPPAGSSEESGELERAALDYQQAIQFSAFAIRAYGTDILRAGSELGKEPFPNFPGYITFEDSTLSTAPIPIKNEYWQLATNVDGQAKARFSKAKLLWRSSINDEEKRQQAKQEAKTVAIHGYLNMALMAAGQSEEEFSRNDGEDVRASMALAGDLFDKINEGVNPLGNDGSFIPNESFAAIYTDAQEAVSQARQAELTARDDKRFFDQNQVSLRNELLSQRSQYITPLTLLTGIDPGDYNDLQTVVDRKDYRATFESRLANLEQNYPNADPKGLGEFGAAVAAVLDAELNLNDQVVSLNNLYESVKVSRWANEQVRIINGNATAQLKANDVVRGYANSLSVSTDFQGVSVSFSPGSIISGYLNAEDRDIQLLQQAEIANVQLEAEIRRSLLQVANYSIAIRRAAAQIDQAELRLDSLRAQMERLIEDLAHVRATGESLYFLDPSFRITASQSEQRAVNELEFAVDRLYRLAKTLEYWWTEPYENPVNIPVASLESESLENPLFDIFKELEDVFVIRSADEAQDYLDALKAWDSKLRRVNVVSVRGPNFSGPISARSISLREDVFGYKPDPSRNYTLADSVADFRNLLEENRLEAEFNVLNPLADLRFPLGIADNSYFPATGSRWNMRIHSVSADVFAESGFSDQQVAEIDLIQSGMTTLRTFFADPPDNDLLFNLTFNVDNLDRTVFSTAFPAKINGATGGRPLTEFESQGLAGRPVAATEWILRIDTDNPTNREIDFSKIKDIILKISYTYGNPQEFSSF